MFRPIFGQKSRSGEEAKRALKPMSSEELCYTTTSLVQSVVGPLTGRVYGRAWDLFRAYLWFYRRGDEALKLPVCVDAVLEFIALLDASGYASSTIATYVSALGFPHRINGFQDPTSHPMVVKCLKVLQKGAVARQEREPITVDLLSKLIRALSWFCDDYHSRLFGSMFSLLFYACLRVNEACLDVRVPWNTLQFHNVSILGNQVCVKFVAYKHSVGSHTIWVDGVPDSTCPVIALGEYLACRVKQSGPLFVDSKGVAVSRSWFMAVLKHALRLSGAEHFNINTHSFRIGGATYLCDQGWSDMQIRKFGRWNSNAVYKYVRSLDRGRMSKRVTFAVPGGRWL